MRAGRRALVRASAGVVALLVLGEAACRLVERSRCRTHCALTCDPHPHWGWWHTAGAAGTCQLCAGDRLVWRTHARYDARGLRTGRLVAPTPPPGTFRILVLGDSYTEGLQVAAPWPRRLERRLNRDGALRYEVLNAGVAGWSIDNALLYVREEGWRYRPDLVLYAFDTGNDVFEADHDLIRAGPCPYPAKPWFALETDGLVLQDFPLPAELWGASIVRRAQRVLEDRSALGRALVALAARASTRAAAASPAAESVPRMGQNYLAETVPEWRRAWRLSDALLAALRAEVERRGARFAVVVVNEREEVTARWPTSCPRSARCRTTRRAESPPHPLPHAPRGPVRAAAGALSRTVRRDRHAGLPARAGHPLGTCRARPRRECRGVRAAGAGPRAR